MMEKYVAGTKRGTGIAFERSDNDYIQAQKASLGLLIKEKIDEKKSSLRKLEKITNIHNPQIHAITNGGNNYTIENLLRVLNALDLTIFIDDKPISASYFSEKMEEIKKNKLMSNSSKEVYKILKEQGINSHLESSHPFENEETGDYGYNFTLKDNRKGQISLLNNGLISWYN